MVLRVDRESKLAVPALEPQENWAGRHSGERVSVQLGSGCWKEEFWVFSSQRSRLMVWIDDKVVELRSKLQQVTSQHAGGERHSWRAVTLHDNHICT